MNNIEKNQMGREKTTSFQSYDKFRILSPNDSTVPLFPLSVQCLLHLSCHLERHLQILVLHLLQKVSMLMH